MAYNIVKGKIQFSDSTTGSIESMVDTHSDQSITGSKDFQTLTGSSVHVKNNLGIGTTQPETKIHIQSGSAGTIATTVGALLTLESSEKPKIHFQSPNAYGGSIIFGSVTDNDEGQIDYDHGSDRFLFKTGGNTKMTILGDNVGINAANPTEKLEVNGNIKTSGITATGTISGSGAISGSSFHGAFHGAGAGITGIPATSLNLGDSTDNDSGNLIVKISGSGGLESTSAGLRVNPSVAAAHTPPANADTFLISDSAASNVPKKITYQNLASAITSGLSTLTTAGNNGDIQIKNGAALQGSSNLNFNTSTNILSVTGKISASIHVSSSNFVGSGVNLTGIPKIDYTSSAANFAVLPAHSLLGINSSGSVVTASFAAANSYQAGQTFTFKDIAGSGSTNHIVIKPSGSQKIDGNSLVKIKANYGAVSIASDGASNFYIVSTS